ncbi:MAG: hypothetical protein U1F53_20740 [Burkholderiaceae bacterium]
MNLPVIHPKPAHNEPYDVDHDPDTQRLVYIHVTAEDPDPSSIHFEDWDALGLWAVVVPVDADQPANVALDAFHSTVPIKWMHSVTWTVRDAASGCRLLRDDGVEWYTLQEQAQAIHFVGHLG